MPSPTALGDGRFFITGDYNAGCAMWKVDHQADQWTVSEIFRKPQGTCDSKCHNAMLYKGHLYANSSYTGLGLECLDLTGKVLWKTGNNPEFGLGGGLIIADGMIFVMDGGDDNNSGREGGTLRLVEASPDGYKELAKAKVLSGYTVWGLLVLSDGKLLVRDQKQLKCLDVKAP